MSAHAVPHCMALAATFAQFGGRGRRVRGPIPKLVEQVLLDILAGIPPKPEIDPTPERAPISEYPIRHPHARIGMGTSPSPLQGAVSL
jgi:hypothetical protein